MGFRGPSNDANSRKGKSPPPDDTHQEAAYLKMLGEKQRPVRIKLMDGDMVRGWIEYYDRRMVRLTREGAPNLFIFKHEIAYIAEDSWPQAACRTASAPARNGNSASGPGMTQYLPEVEAIAREAGALLMSYFAGHVTIEYKGDVDLVTEADRASEKTDRRALARALAGTRNRRRRRRTQRSRRRLSLVCRSAGRHHELCARLSGVLRFDRAGAQG